MTGPKATIPLLATPPKRRLSFPRLVLAMLRNPVASWAEDFYDEPIVVYRTLGLDTAFVMDPELIETILLDDSGSFSKRPLYDQVLGEAGGKGLLIAEGDDWRWQRRIAAPLFRSEALLAYVPAFAAAGAGVLARWKEAERGSLQTIGRDMTDAAMQAMQDTILGGDLSAEDSRAIAEAGTAFLQPTPWKIVFASLKVPPWIPHPGSARMRRAGRNLRKMAERVLERRRQGHGENAELLGRLVAARDPGTDAKMPESLIIDNVVTFLMVGQETTAQALTWTLYLLALLPEWQEKVREEVRCIAGEGPLSGEQLQRLELLDAFFLEAMRLYPPAPSLMRVTTKPVRLDNTELRAGATIVIPIYVVHRHRRLWRDPLLFDPSRFASEARAIRHRCAYMPFSTGPRSCIGGSFSMIEVKVLLATLLARARFERPEDEVPTPLARITLRPKKGLRLRVTVL
ncbi:MAG: cytochrome P450 [Methyloceanibacter sp.]